MCSNSWENSLFLLLSVSAFDDGQTWTRRCYSNVKLPNNLNLSLRLKHYLPVNGVKLQQRALSIVQFQSAYLYRNSLAHTQDGLIYSSRGVSFSSIRRVSGGPEVPALQRPTRSLNLSIILSTVWTQPWVLWHGRFSLLFILTLWTINHKV